ncbi:major facilitator family protein [Teredinibacter turnerae T7901]|uniref:Major facilitator family protein n=1 Tax=Teredinibacter turnerae (strain ATCC 39867 / T7901) TaxID=377629 RepID=C5BIU7_TERTT|nr:MFS transporter [Teredinibacter turnerae]ACR10878.1 major facilitator family protein [Teredinibacter turnerae T7901]
MQSPTSQSAPSRKNNTLFLCFTLLIFLAAASTPTPMYHLYQEQWHFSSAMLTLVFGVYALMMLASLLIAGGLSDHIGRKPVIAAAIVLEIVAVGLFILAQNVHWLLFARVMQGTATGIASSVIAASMLDADHQRGPLFNSLSSISGLGLGALVSSLLIFFAPMPLALSYWVLLLLLLVALLWLISIEETASLRPGALASLIPRIAIPAEIRGALMTVAPVNVSGWALGGFYLSLAPSVIVDITHTDSVLIAGGAVFLLTLSGAISVFVQRNRAPEAMLAYGATALALGLGLFLVSIQIGQIGVLLLGSVIAGSGFGSSFVGSMRSVLPLAPASQRAGLTAVFFIISYLALSIPSMAAGLLIKQLGLHTTALGFGTLLLVMILLAIVLQRLRKHSKVSTLPG